MFRNIILLIFIFSIAIATTLMTNSITFGQESSVNILLKEGIEKISLSEYENSIIIFDQVLEIEPNNLVALNNKAYALLNLGENEEAIIYYDIILQIDPGDIDAQSKKGAALVTLGKNKEAEIYLDQVLLKEPEHLSALSNKGVILAKFEKYDEAILYFDRVLKIEEFDFGALRNKGMALIKLEKHEEAVQIFDKLLKINPENTKNNTDELIRKIDLASTKNSKYYVYLQVEVRNSFGELVGFIESDNADYLPLSLTEKFVDSYPLAKTISKNGETFELRQLPTTHIVEEFHPFGGQTKLYDPETLDSIVYFSTLHHGFPVDKGDIVTLTWNIMKKIT